MVKKDNILGILRISLGLIFIWAFLDKLLGLGFATSSDKSWLAGGSPTAGFLLNAVKGPLVPLYHAIAGNPIVDWLFMIGLLGIGIGLTFGIAMRLSCYSGALLMLLMWSSLLPPDNHPFLDDHIIYALVMFSLLFTNADEILGLGKWWKSLEITKSIKILS